MSAGLVAAIVIPLVVALIGVIVPVMKLRADKRTSTELAHAEPLIEGYERVLAALDAKWYWTLKRHLQYLPHPDIEDERAEYWELHERWKAAYLPLFHIGTDLIAAHSHDVKTARFATAYLDGMTGMEYEEMEVEQYDQARQWLIDCQRIDTGLDGELKLEKPRRRKKRLAKLRAKVRKPPTKLQRLHDKAVAAGAEGVIVIGGGDVLLEEVKRVERIGEEMEESLLTTESRLKHWQAKGLWSEPLSTLP